MKPDTSYQKPDNEKPEPSQTKSAEGEKPAPVAELKDAKEQLLRFKADFENTKKRLERDKSDAIRFANERLLAEILPVVDNFDRAMISISEGHDLEKVKQGLKLAQDELHKILEMHGVQIIQSVGLEFNPQLHEAVAVVEDPKFKEGMVVDEIQKGYVLNGRLIRPSKVRIAGHQS